MQDDDALIKELVDTFWFQQMRLKYEERKYLSKEI